ncbi:MAG: LamG-like jellyroll fold domain-containing protein [Armatimonadota bacterium]
MLSDTEELIALRTLLATLTVLMVACTLTAAQDGEENEVQLAEPFMTEYSGDDATGEHVIGLWQFNQPDPTADASGNGHDATLQGGEFVEDGRFGGALRTFRGHPIVDEPHRVMVANAPELSPSGPFTMEMWINPAEELNEDYPDSMLIDKKYIDDADYQLVLTRETAPDTRRLLMHLGFGNQSATWRSEAFSVDSGTWRHIAFVYDGAGTGSFFVDGSAMGSETKDGFGAITAGGRPLHIGDRVGSLYHGFPGLIDQVRISSEALEFRPAAFEMASDRTVFERMEQVPPVRFAVTNRLRDPLDGAVVRITLNGAPQVTEELPAIASGESAEVIFPLDTSLRPDEYTVAATVEVTTDPPFTSTEQFDLTIVARETPDRMPVVMWGGAGNDDHRDWLKRIGFTHYIGLPCDFGKVWEAEGPTEAHDPDRVATNIENLDRALKEGLRVVSSLSPGRWARSKEDYQRVNRDGEPHEREDVCGLFDRIQQFCNDVGASMAQTYGHHPAYETALIHTEVRGHANTCFHDHDREAFREFAGYDIPEQVGGMRGVHYDALDDFPADRVIPDDWPLYVYYRWLWDNGDGWNTLHSELHHGLHESDREDFWTFHDPAVRTAKVYGQGGDVDYLSQWTYSYPDPLRIGLATEEMLQMVEGADRPDQLVMKMTQIIWYRNQTAPEPGEEVRQQSAEFTDQDIRPQGTGTVDETGRYVARWEREIPDARFVTIAPMHMREALWSKIARPIKGIMYHGIGSLLPDVTHGSYRYTHPDTKYELQRLCETVVEPLGPTLVQVPGRQSDVALLESFASEMFARRGTWGWNATWIGEMFLIANYAGLQAEVIFDETIRQDGLDNYRVLMMPDSDVLTESMVEAIEAFQARGGIVVGDENTCPAITPDILIETHTRAKNAEEARQLNIEKALALREQLDPHYERYADSSTPDVIPYVRSYGSTDYVFGINDRREFGLYVGQHELVMENGLPTDATLTVDRDGHVYDLVAGREIVTGDDDGATSIDWHFGPCEGRVFMITERPIADVRITAPQQASAGDSITIAAEVLADNGDRIDAVVPVRIDLIDPNGHSAEFSGFYGAKDGGVEITCDLAPNDVPGTWRVRVEELASGRAANAYLTVSAG